MQYPEKKTTKSLLVKCIINKFNTKTNINISEYYSVNQVQRQYHHHQQQQVVAPIQHKHLLVKIIKQISKAKLIKHINKIKDISPSLFIRVTKSTIVIKEQSKSA